MLILKLDIASAAVIPEGLILLTSLVLFKVLTFSALAIPIWIIFLDVVNLLALVKVCAEDIVTG